MGKIQKLSDYFCIDKSDLIDDTPVDENKTFLKNTELSSKDQFDIKKNVDLIMASLESKNGESLYYDGTEVHLTDETIDLLRSALTIAMQAVKIENKDKFDRHNGVN